MNINVLVGYNTVIFLKISISSEHWGYEGEKYTYMDWASEWHCLDFRKYTIKI